MNNDHFDLCLKEAKDNLSHINSSIKETRTHTYFLFALVFGLASFFSTDFFLEKYGTLKSHIFYSMPFLMLLVGILCNRAVRPTFIHLNGIPPNFLEPIMTQETAKIQHQILDTYQQSIDTNQSVLEKLSKGYKKAFFVLIFWFILVFAFWYMFSKSACFWH